MPIKKTGHFDMKRSIVSVTKAKLSTFLTDEELSNTTIHIVDGKINSDGPSNILDKIKANLGENSNE